mmetsp:Transcript_42133/g.78038  ORF Transcript_42133/g.78038 Transcript_42133/m.78038 type:complete len:200 (-) Transcript_42133:653-1252(-)
MAITNVFVIPITDFDFRAIQFHTYFVACYITDPPLVTSRAACPMRLCARDLLQAKICETFRQLACRQVFTRRDKSFFQGGVFPHAQTTHIHNPHAFGVITTPGHHAHLNPPPNHCRTTKRVKSIANRSIACVTSRARHATIFPDTCVSHRSLQGGDACLGCGCNSGCLRNARYVQHRCMSGCPLLCAKVNVRQNALGYE